MTRPKVPPGKFATSASAHPSNIPRLEQRQRTAQACESCKRRKQKVRLCWNPIFTAVISEQLPSLRLLPTSLPVAAV